MTRLNSIMPVLLVSDMDRAVDWYTRALGFALAWRAANDGGGENCMLSSGGINLMLSTGSHLGDTPAFTATLYFETDGVRELYTAVKDAVTVVWPLDTMDCGTLEFGVRDLDGYTLAFAETSS